MDIKHPYQGHYMEGAFLGFVMYAGKSMMEQYAAETAAPVDEYIDVNDPRSDAELQNFIDWCVVQFGTPEQIEADDEEDLP